MSTTQLPTQPETVPVIEDRTHRLVIINRWLLGAVALLVAALAVLAVYVFVGFGDDPDQALVEDFVAAFNADDSDALRDLFTADAIVMAPEGVLAGGREAVLVSAAGAYDQTFRFSITGDAVTNGDYVSVPIRQGRYNVEHDAFLVLRVQDGQIAHLWMSRSP